jgi:hypothetical protein
VLQVSKLSPIHLEKTNLDGGTNGGLELDNSLSVVGDLLVSF